MNKKNKIDLNSDIGEGFGQWKAGDGRDDEMMELISSANIATGFHAGDPNIMNHTVQLAKKFNVGLGAHPAFRDLVGFGRRTMNATREELINDIVYQVGSLYGFAKLHGINVQHVKPHGALYMHMANDEELSEMFVKTMKKMLPEAYIFCMDISKTYQVAKALGQPVIRELYGDRFYNESGSIVFTRGMNALNSQEVAQKILTACNEGKVQTVEGSWINIEFESICIHSDTPGAYDLIKSTCDVLKENNISITNHF